MAMPDLDDDTLIFDAGTHIVGIYSVRQDVYVPYEGNDIPDGIQRLIRAREIVSYNGDRYDLGQLNHLMGGDSRQPLAILGCHIDMRVVCWDPILGRSLRDTYEEHFGPPPKTDGSYIGSNQLDVQMTFRLWERWVAGHLRRSL